MFQNQKSDMLNFFWTLLHNNQPVAEIVILSEYNKN